MTALLNALIVGHGGIFFTTGNSQLPSAPTPSARVAGCQSPPRSVPLRPTLLSSHSHLPHSKHSTQHAHPRSTQFSISRTSFAQCSLTGLGGYDDDPLSDHEPHEDSSRIPSNLFLTRPSNSSKPDTDVRAFTQTMSQLCFPRCSPSLPFWPGRTAESTRFYLFRKSVFSKLPLGIHPESFFIPFV